MGELNNFYPMGENFKDFYEYHLNCHSCGKLIKIFLPVDKYDGSYIYNSAALCHQFPYNIERQFLRKPFEHKMIKLRNDMMGGGVTCDSYNLYPVINGETDADRKKRLVLLKLSELDQVMKAYPDKKKEIVTEVVNRNETILNALETVLKKYEASKDCWPEYDNKLKQIDCKYSAEDLIRSFGDNTRYQSQTAPGNKL